MRFSKARDASPGILVVTDVTVGSSPERRATLSRRQVQPQEDGVVVAPDGRAGVEPVPGLAKAEREGRSVRVERGRERLHRNGVGL